MHIAYIYLYVDAAPYGEMEQELTTGGTLPKICAEQGDGLGITGARTSSRKTPQPLFLIHQVVDVTAHLSRLVALSFVFARHPP